MNQTAFVGFLAAQFQGAAAPLEQVTESGRRTIVRTTLRVGTLTNIAEIAVQIAAHLLAENWKLLKDGVQDLMFFGVKNDGARRIVLEIVITPNGAGGLYVSIALSSVHCA